MNGTETNDQIKETASVRPEASLPQRQERALAGVTDSRLVEEARRGNRDAFGELVQRYEQRLMRVIGRFIADRETVRDLAQETFLRAYERLDQFDPSRRFGPWLFRIGVNLTLDYLRKHKRRGRWTLFSEASTDEQDGPVVSDPRRQQDLSQEVQAVLNQLPEKYRNVLILRDLENFSTSEIAAILNRSEPTIRWRLAEARNRFQKLWSKRLQENEPLVEQNIPALPEQQPRKRLTPPSAPRTEGKEEP